MCVIVRVLYALVPWKRFRAFLLRAHIAGCPRCGAEGPEAAGLAGLVRPPGWIASEASLWPEIEKRMDAAARSARPGPRGARPGLLPRLAAAAGSVLALAALAVLIGRHAPHGEFGPAGPAPGEPRVEVLSVEVEGRGGRSSVYQTEGASFIWLYPGPRNGGGK